MKLEQNDNAEDEQNSTDAVPSAADDVSTFYCCIITVVIRLKTDDLRDSHHSCISPVLVIINVSLSRGCLDTGRCKLD